MSYFSRFAVSVLLLAACSSSKAPEAPAAESPSVSSGVSAAGAAGAVDPAAPVDPAAVDPSGASGEPAAPSSGTAVGDAPVSTTLFVADALAPCEGEGARKCLSVRGSEGEKWRNFYGSIAGFEYEPSYTYELVVEVSELANPPPDAPSIHYRLLEIKSKKKTGK